MLNLGMGLGDDVLFWVPGIPVFVDSRLESYPPEFLAAVLAAQSNDAALAKLIDRYEPQWLFANHDRPALRDRIVTLLRAGWQAVYVDSAHVVLVRPTPATQDYRRAHAIDLRRAQPGDLVTTPALRTATAGELRRADRRARIAVMSEGRRPGPAAAGRRRAGRRWSRRRWSCRACRRCRGACGRTRRPWPGRRRRAGRSRATGSAIRRSRSCSATSRRCSTFRARTWRRGCGLPPSSGRSRACSSSIAWRRCSSARGAACWRWCRWPAAR